MKGIRMPRIKTIVDKELLQEAINQVEETTTFPNLTTMQEAAANKYNELKTDDLKEINKSIVYLRIKEFGLSYKTVKGKRGRSKGFGSGNGKRTARKKKFASDPMILKSLDAIDEHFKDDSFDSKLKKLRNGSMRAAITLYCIDCCGGQRAEVARCSSYSCPLFPFKPYKGKEDQED